MVSIVHAARDIARVREISTVLVRHGFGEVVARLGLARPKGTPDVEPTKGIAAEEPSGTAKNDRVERDRRQAKIGVRLRRVLEDLGPSFVKLGQIASTRADLLPAEIIAELKKLQDAVPPVPFDDIRAQVERSLGVELEEIFESVDPEPLAAASVAQVHRAVLRLGEELRDVVLKVQRPGAASTIASDLDLLHMLATLIERTIPETRTYSPTGLVQQFDRAIHDELDFTVEAENARRFTRNFAEIPSIRFPSVYREASSNRVITLEFFDGLKLEEAVAQGASRQAIAHTAIQTMVKQIFEDGFFHADPHPGNVVVMGDHENPVLGLIDLGMVGRLSPALRDATVDLMMAAIRADHDAIADAMYAIGTPRRRVDMAAYRAEMAIIADRYLGKSMAELDASCLVRDLVRVATTYGLEIPTDFLLVGKAMMTVEGIGKQLDPTLNIFEESRPYFVSLLRQRYSPERIGLHLIKRIERLSETTSNLPLQLADVLEDLRLGRLTVSTENLKHEWAVDRLARRLLAGVLSGSALLSAALLLIGNKPIAAAATFGLGSLWLAGHVVQDWYRSLRRGPR